MKITNNDIETTFYSRNTYSICKWKARCWYIEKDNSVSRIEFRKLGPSYIKNRNDKREMFWDNFNDGFHRTDGPAILNEFGPTFFYKGTVFIEEKYWNA